MAVPLHSNLQSRPFTLERPALRSRRSHVLVCKARSDRERMNIGRAAGGLSGLAVYLTSVPKAWAEADIELPPQLTSLTAPQLPDVNIQLPTNVQLPTSAGGIGQLISDYPRGTAPCGSIDPHSPLAFSQASGGSSVQGVSAARALAVLKDEDPVVFLDIRSAADFKSQGSPDLSSIKKAAIRLPFTKVGHAAAPDSTLPRTVKGELSLLSYMLT